jgi:hypothetical protein
VFAAMISDLRKRIENWRNVNSKEAVAAKSMAKKDALWKWNKEERRFTSLEELREELHESLQHPESFEN